MAGISIHDTSIVTFQRGETALRNMLKKASESADAASLADAKLCEDMKPLAFQVQMCSNLAKKTVWRLTGAEIETWADDEQTLDQLIARCDKTLSLLDGVDPKQIEGKESEIVELGLGPHGTKQLPAKDYVLTYALPNFYFHLQTAYAILRMKGIPLGKFDYLAPFMNITA